jgi:hypothetical protein
LLENQYEIRKLYGAGKYTTTFHDGFIVVWKPLPIEDFISYTKEQSDNRFPPSFLEDEIFRKDYVAPPIRKRQRDIETIILPKEIFEGLPKSTSKVKARRLKVVSEAFAAEKAARLKEMRKQIDDEIIE